MKIELDLPESTIQWLRSQSRETELTLDEYAAEVFEQYLIAQAESDNDKLENRPDWQAALERSREDWKAGRVHEHADVVARHESHLD